MSRARKLRGGALAVIGFLLSPLSWWNDLFINLPLALGFAWLVSLFYRPAFTPAVVVGYWLTNVLGFILMHKGAQDMLARDGAPPSWNRRALYRALGVSLLYTLLIVALVKFGVLKPLTALTDHGLQN